MTALTADRTGTYLRDSAVIPPLSMLVGTDIFYKGALLGVVPGTGTILPLADTSNMIFAGVAAEFLDNSAGVTGARIKIIPMGIIRVVDDAGSLAAADVGTIVTAVDDQTIDVVGNTTNDVEVGRIYEVDSLGTWVSFMSNLLGTFNA